MSQEPAPSKLPIPLWVVTPRLVESPPANEPCGEPRHALGYASVEKLMQFLNTRKAGDWRMRRVMHDADLMILVADLHMNNVVLICFEPNLDGSAGTAFPLRDVLNQVDRTKIVGAMGPRPGG
jgi:hypothetical protein